MFFELREIDFPKVLHLYNSLGMNFPLILAVILNKQRGQIFADSLEYPRSTLVVTNFGFMIFIGDDINENFNKSLVALFTKAGSVRPSYLLWYSPPIEWQARLDSFLPDRVRRRERMRLEFHNENASYINEEITCPPGFEIRNLDFELIPKTQSLGINIGSRLWSSSVDFVHNGLGVCIIRNEKIVSLCYSACVADNIAEIDIITQQEYRGLGLGYVVAQGFIRECIEKNITPTWDCFISNVASLKLAEKLGFQRKFTYPFYSFNIPLPLNL